MSSTPEERRAPSVPELCGHVYGASSYEHDLLRTADACCNDAFTGVAVVLFVVGLLGLAFLAARSLLG